MSKTRKRLLQMAMILSFATAFLQVLFFVCLMGNVLNCADWLLQWVNLLQNQATQTVLNIVTVYAFASVIANLLFAHVYLYFANQHYVQFRSGSKWFVFGLHFATAVVLLAPLVFLLALLLPATKMEQHLLQVGKDLKQTQKQFNQIMKDNPLLFVASVKIGVLKHKYKNKEITQEEYYKMIHKILETGVQEDKF